MTIFCKQFAVIAGLLAFPGCAVAVEPVRYIGIYVEPFCRSAPTPDWQPQVAVGKQYNGLLASNKRADILAARDLIAANPKLVTPMTLMVLAVRFYDVGLRATMPCSGSTSPRSDKATIVAFRRARP
jgi:hypothetical protein